MYSFTKCASEIAEFLKAIEEENYKLFLVDGELRTHEQLCSILKFKSPETNEVFKMIWQYAVKSEMYAPGSMNIFMQALSKLLQRVALEHTVTVETLTPKSSSITSAVPNKDNLHDHVRKSLDKKLASILLQAIELAGLHGKIFIEKSQNDKISIELSTGFSFELNTNLANKGEYLDCAVIIIDGYVENVSELNKLFVELSEKKQRCIIFGRGFSNDIVTTVTANRVRGIFECILCVAPFELTSVNTLTDIAVVTGTIPVSSNTGDFISNTSLIKAGKASRVRILENQAVISNAETSGAVGAHILDLLARIKDASEHEISKLLSKRLKSLQSTTVTIRLANNSQYLQHSGLLDRELRTIKSIVSYGLYDNKPAVWQVANQLAVSCVAMISGVGDIILT